MQKGTLLSCVVQYTPEAVLYSTLLDRILRSYYLFIYIFNNDVYSSVIPQTCSTSNSHCSLSLIYWMLRFILSQIVYSFDDSCPDPWPPVWHSSPAHLERYWLTCLRVRTKHCQYLNLLTSKHVARPGGSVNLVVECQYSGLLVVYQLHYSYYTCSVL